ncbi:MAG: IclR family transcriptional regulator [Desulfuromusa sp.]|nr:IclR family transcriptional regulator [Desulfuromusa sp.]
MIPGSTHKAVEKALKILFSFVPDNRPQGTIELSEHLNIHKSTVSRLLQVLTRFNLLEKHPHTQKFHLGKAAGTLGEAFNISLNASLVSLVQPQIDRLRYKLDETVVLEVLARQSTVLLYAAEGPGPVFIREAAGEKRPAHTSAGGKLLLAHAPPEVRDRYLAHRLPKVTPNTITDLTELNVQFMKIRKQGFAIDNEEVHIGIRAVAVPIFNENQNAIAAIVMSGMAQKIALDQCHSIAGVLAEGSAKITKLLIESATNFVADGSD